MHWVPGSIPSTIRQFIKVGLAWNTVFQGWCKSCWLGKDLWSRSHGPHFPIVPKSRGYEWVSPNSEWVSPDSVQFVHKVHMSTIITPLTLAVDKMMGFPDSWCKKQRRVRFSFDSRPRHLVFLRKQSLWGWRDGIPTLPHPYQAARNACNSSSTYTDT